jgi:hypothetical protein
VPRATGSMYDLKYSRRYQNLQLHVCTRVWWDRVVCNLWRAVEVDVLMVKLQNAGKRRW